MWVRTIVVIEFFKPQLTPGLAFLVSAQEEAPCLGFGSLPFRLSTIVTEHFMCLHREPGPGT